MPRTKGSKNKPKTMTADFATQIAEKQSAKEALAAEIASITANIDTLKADLKEKKTALKKAEKEVASLEAKKAKADAKATEEARGISRRGMCWSSGFAEKPPSEVCRRKIHRIRLVSAHHRLTIAVQ